MPRSTPCPRQRQRSGSNALEFALILPFLTVFVGGVVDWTRFLAENEIMMQACRDGARSGAIEADDDAGPEAKQTVEDALIQQGYNEARATINTSVFYIEGEQAIEVTVSYPFDSVFGFPVALPAAHEVTAVYLLQEGD